MSETPKILVVMTGGTICSTVDENGFRYSDASKINIIGDFKNGKSPCADCVDFDATMPTDILSENMTVESWNVILDEFRKVNCKRYIGVIVLHGTDTLGFMAPLLSLVLSGLPIPVMLVSAQLPLDQKGTNGHANFKAAVELIVNGIKPNVYAVYRNSDGNMYLHLGSHLMQCQNFSDDFFSPDMERIKRIKNAKAEGRQFETDSLYLYKMSELTASVLCVTPYVGLDYSAFDLSGVRTVVHGTYHTESVCVERSRGTGDYSKFSLLTLIDRCRKENIDVFLAPCSATAYSYESTGDALKHGARPITAQNFNMAYVKLLVGGALGLKGDALTEFANTAVNYEML